MFLHIGENEIITNKEIIGVFDIELMSKNKNNKSIEKNARKESRWYKISGKENKSVILNEKNEYIISPISVSTLKKRIMNFKLNIDTVMKEV